jgi:DNA-binding LytR/AlgR family response regulator|tara:strand:+ start:1382 stop:2071 length:690 start_codon:yes stop_codon:yes gene_type:complete
MIKAIIVDDDELCRAVISDLLEEVEDIECVANFGNALDAFKFLNENDVDVIFLDVEMPKMGGMELLRNLQIKPLVVMITSHDEFALESYEYDVTDFLKKPLNTPRFLKTIEKIKKTLVGEATVKKNDDYIFIKSDSKLVQIKLEDIHWVEALGNYMRLHTDKEKHTVLSTMKEIESKLPTKDFIRIQRSFIVRLDKILSIEDNYVIMKNKEIHIGKAYKDEFNNRLNFL